MYPVSDEFHDALTRSHVLSSRVDIIDNEGNVVIQPKISEGFVRVDRTADVRRQLDFTAHEIDLLPSDVHDLLHPLSATTFHVYRGLVSPIEEEVPLGIFSIEDSTIDDSGDSLRIDVKAFDRTKKIQRNRWTSIHIIHEGTNIAEAIRGIISSRDPGVEYSWDNDTDITTWLTPPMIFGTGQGGGDPWEDAQKLATSIGHELFFDVHDICTLRPVPNVRTDPSVFSLKEGPGGLLLDVTRKLTRDEVYNHVIVYAAGYTLNEPIRLDIYDDDPASPTYYLGPFGDVPTYLQSRLILTTAQGYAAGYALLQDKLGAPENVELITIPHPALDAGDVIDVTRERMGMVNSHQVIDKLTMPLAYDQPLNIICRENRLTS